MSIAEGLVQFLVFISPTKSFYVKESWLGPNYLNLET